MAQTREVRGVATSIRTEGNRTIIRYHDTDVVTFDETSVCLDSGGWETVTTKRRMNQASHQFNLGFTVFQRRHRWFVGWWDHRPDVPFSDGMTLPREPMRWTGEHWTPCHA